MKNTRYLVPQLSSMSNHLSCNLKIQTSVSMQEIWHSSRDTKDIVLSINQIRLSSDSQRTSAKYNASRRKLTNSMFIAKSRVYYGHWPTSSTSSSYPKPIPLPLKPCTILVSEIQIAFYNQAVCSKALLYHRSVSCQKEKRLQLIRYAKPTQP